MSNHSHCYWCGREMRGSDPRPGMRSVVLCEFCIAAGITASDVAKEIDLGPYDVTRIGR